MPLSVVLGTSPTDETGPSAPTGLEAQVGAVLAHLDDVAYLQTHPLARHFQVEPGRGAVSAAKLLRQALLDAVAALRPGADLPLDATAWRGYQILHLHYVEGRSIPAILDRLAISRSQYYRDSRRAVAAVTALLAARWALPATAAPTIVPNAGRAGDDARDGGPWPRPGQLPLPLTSFVGREAELAEVARLLGTVRLLTLTGAGGCGKTRLALQVAADLAGSAADGVALVELAGQSDQALLPEAVAAALGLREEAGRPILTTLTAALRDQRLLLLLDNCEHLLDACAHLAEALLPACPHLRALATSREPLRVAGEVCWRVPSLAVPPAAPALPPEQLRQYGAVQLFIERAAAALPSFALTTQNAAAVARVCIQVDGIPLAIELAAARLSGLAVEQLAARLEHDFRLLQGGSRTALPRQRTLQATLDWSYDLLSEQERALFDRLSVFTAGFTLEAAEWVGAGGQTAAEEVLDLLLGLVDKSLVVAEAQSEGTGRYRLLEPLRQYGGECLAASGDAATVQERHAAHFLALAEEAEPHLWESQSARWLNRLELEYGNLRSAMHWWRRSGNADRGLRLGGALHAFWYLRGHFSEGRMLLGAVLTMPEAAQSTARARALLAAGLLALNQGDTQAAQALLGECLPIFQQRGDRRGVADVQCGLGLSAFHQGNYADARPALAESLAAFRTLSETAQVVRTLCWLGRAAYAQGDHAAARVHLNEGLELARALKLPQFVAFGTECLGDVASAEGDTATTRALWAAALALYQETGDKAGIATVDIDLGWSALQQGDAREAQRWYRAALEIARDLGFTVRVCSALDGLAAAAARRLPERCLRLAGAAAALRQAMVVSSTPVEHERLERRLATARQALGAEAASAAWAAGLALPREQAIAEALADDTTTDRERRPSRRLRPPRQPLAPTDRP